MCFFPNFLWVIFKARIYQWIDQHNNTIDPSRSVTSCAPKPKPSSAAKVKVVNPKTKNKAAPPAKPAPEEPKKRGNPKSEVAPAPTPKRSRRG